MTHIRQNYFSHVTLITALALGFLMSGCDKGDAAGNKDADHDQAVKEGNARATGGACRHAGRALEDCFALNPDSDRGLVFAGWKDMNDYMRENKMEEVKPLIDRSKPAPAAESKDKSSKNKVRADQ